MKMDPSVKFILKGFASKEGTYEHNIILSEDRANSVKAYLVNSGVSSANLTTKGYGIKHPIADNSTEAGRILNRRVEIHKQN
jgi:OOP family OmpA-OmpF porin